MADNYRWIVLGVVFIARTSMGYQFQSIGSIGPILVVQLAIDFAILGSLIGVYKLPGFLLAIPSGFLSNKFGEKAILVLGMSMMAIGGFVTALSDDYNVVYWGRAFSGVGGVLFNVLSAKMIADWFADKELTLAMAIHVNSWPFGIALGLLTQATLAEMLSLQAMLHITAAFCAAGVLLLLIGTRDIVRNTSQSSTAFFAWNLSQREFLLVSLSALIWLLFNANLILVVSFAPAYLSAIGLDVASAGQLTSVGTWLGVITIPIGGYIAQRWVSSDVFMTSMFIIGCLATFAILWLSDPLLAFIAFGVFAWAPAGAIVALPVNFLRQSNRAIGMGLFFSYYYLGIGIFPTIAGYLRDTTGDPSAPIILAAWLLIGALGCLAALRISERLMPPDKVNA